MSKYVILHGELYHYGVKGMKWGSRKSTKNQQSLKLNKMTVEAGKKAALVTLGIIGVTSFADWHSSVYGTSKASIQKRPRLSKVEHKRVMSAVSTNTSLKQKQTQAIITMAINNHKYTFRNNFDGTFDVLYREKIPDSTTGMLPRTNDDK